LKLRDEFNLPKTGLVVIMSFCSRKVVTELTLFFVLTLIYLYRLAETEIWLIGNQIIFFFVALVLPLLTYEC